MDGYKTYNDVFKELKYIGSNKFEIDSVQYSIVQAEKEDFGGGSLKYTLTLDKGKIIKGETFPISIKVYTSDEGITYGVGYNVYGVWFMSSFKAKWLQTTGHGVSIQPWYLNLYPVGLQSLSVQSCKKEGH